MVDTTETMTNGHGTPPVKSSGDVSTRSELLPIVIAGGGCVGLFLALLLCQSDIPNKAIVRFYDPALAANSTYAYTHGVLDLATQTVTMLAIPACKAGSVQSVSIEDGKAHIITNHEGNTDGYVYIYDIPTGAVTKGMRVPSGYSYLLRIDKL